MKSHTVRRAILTTLSLSFILSFESSDGSQVEGLSEYSESIGQGGKKSMVNNSERFSRAAVEFTRKRWDDHLVFFKKHKFSQFWSTAKYGSENESIENYIRRKLGQKKLTAVEKQLVRHSCVEFTLDAVEAGMLSAGMKREFESLEKLVSSNKADGAVLIVALQKLGWKVYYYNTLSDLVEPPNETPEERKDRIAKAVKNLKSRDTEFRRSYRNYGPHWWSWHTAVNKGNYKYPELKVNNATSLVGFGASPPPELANVPFCVAIGNNAYHVFPIVHGEVIEGHSGLDIWNPKIIERNPFNPGRGKNGAPGLKVGTKKDGNGGPTGSSFLYSSGLICIPPGEKI